MPYRVLAARQNAGCMLYPQIIMEPYAPETCPAPNIGALIEWQKKDIISLLETNGYTIAEQDFSSAPYPTLIIKRPYGISEEPHAILNITNDLYYFPK